MRQQRSRRAKRVGGGKDCMKEKDVYKRDECAREGRVCMRETSMYEREVSMKEKNALKNVECMTGECEVSV